MQEYNKHERTIMIAYLERRVTLFEEAYKLEARVYKGQLERTGASPRAIEEALYTMDSNNEREINRLLGMICYLYDYEMLRATLSNDIIAKEDKQVDKIYQALKRLERI